MGAKIDVLLNCGQQSQFSKVRREFDAGRVNLDPPMTCADWPVPGNLTLLHPQTAYTRKPLHRHKMDVSYSESSDYYNSLDSLRDFEDFCEVVIRQTVEENRLESRTRATE